MSMQRSVKEDLISIVVPVYKAELFVGKCIESILNQTYQNIELILVDDGSPDNSGAICDAYAREDSRVVVIHTKNGGVSSARNIGIDSAKGKYIAFVDSDDYIDADFLSHAMNGFQVNDIDLFIGGIRIETFKKGKIIKEEIYNGTNKVYTITQLLDSFNIEYEFIVICGIWSKVYRTSIIRSNNIYFDLNMNLGEDTVFLCDYLRVISRVFFSNKDYYHYYRGNEESLFSKYHPNRFEIYVKVYSKLLDLMHTQKCSKDAIKRMHQLYTQVLLSCIHYEYYFYQSSTPITRMQTIKKVSENIQLRRYLSNSVFKYKDVATVLLLKFKMYDTLDFFFTRYYCSGNKKVTGAKF